MKSTNTKIIEYEAITIEPMKDDMVEIDYEMENESLSSYKCGEIFLQQTQVLCFVCTRCKKRLEDFNEFCSHLHEHTYIQDIIHYEDKERGISEHEEGLIEYRLQDYGLDTGSGAPNVSPENPKSKVIESVEMPEYEDEDLIEFKLEDDSVDTVDDDALILPSEMCKVTGEVSELGGEDVLVLKLQGDCVDADSSTTTLEARRKIMDQISGDEEEFIEISIQHNSVEMDVYIPQPERSCSTLALSTASSHHSSDEENLNSKYVCKSCALQFAKVKDLRQHKCSALTAETNSTASTTKPPIYPCTVCGKIFNRKWNLRTHSFSHTKNKPFKCDRCPATYANKQNLTVHQRRHNGDKPFSCDYCSWTFASSTERITHMRTHTGEKPYVCEECGYGHSTSSQLLEHHRRVHLDVRNFECPDCGKAFRTSSHFRSHHEAVHQDLPRNHKCNVCKAAFKTSAALQAHSKIHKEKRYKCKICNKAFAQHPGLYMHMTTHKNMEKISKLTS